MCVVRVRHRPDDGLLITVTTSSDVARAGEEHSVDVVRVEEAVDLVWMFLTGWASRAGAVTEG